MHTVNKAYTVLKQEGYVKVDRRRGAVIAVDVDKLRTVAELKKELRVILAKGCCKNITREEMHALIDEIYESLSPYMIYLPPVFSTLLCTFAYLLIVTQQLYFAK